jgi:hypothetical protein
MVFAPKIPTRGSHLRPPVQFEWFGCEWQEQALGMTQTRWKQIPPMVVYPVRSVATMWRVP